MIYLYACNVPHHVKSAPQVIMLTRARSVKQGISFLAPVHVLMIVLPLEPFTTMLVTPVILYVLLVMMRVRVARES